MHMGQKFKCPECEYHASYKGDIKKHQQSVHMGLKIRCPEFKYETSWKSALVTHKKFIHMGQKFKCTVKLSLVVFYQT